MEKSKQENVFQDSSGFSVTIEWPTEKDFDDDTTGEKLINPFARAEHKVWTSDPGWGMLEWTEDRLKWGLGRFMKHRGLEMCVARAGAKVAGFSIGYEVTQRQFKDVTFATPLDHRALFLDRERVFWISDVGVVPAWRGRGLGKLVMSRLLQRVKSTHSDIVTVVLRTREDEPRAVALYRGLGFAQIAQVHDVHYPNRIYFWLRFSK